MVLNFSKGIVCSRMCKFTVHNCLYIIAGTMASRQLFRRAMKLGFVDSYIGKMLIYGACGTGKSTFMDLLIENPTKEVRTSTPLAARPMSMFQFDVTNEQHWANLSPEQRKKFLVQVTMHIEAQLEEESGSEEEGISGRGVMGSMPA